MNGRVLLIAFHYPPASSSSGHLRTMAFVRHLPAFGWQPTVLTAHARAYEGKVSGVATDEDAASVQRAFAFDTKRHLGLGGRYPLLLATPDRWVSWWPDAVRKGLRIIKNQQIDVIWSTYPIMTAHLIAFTLHRLTGIPWIADFRDPAGCGPSRLNGRVGRWIENKAIKNAARTTFTTHGACRLYSERFAQESGKGRFDVIPNGFEESAFDNIKGYVPDNRRPCTLVHSGLLYRDGRNPIPFFRALSALKSRGVVTRETLHVVLRASGHEEEYRAALTALGLEDIVSLEPQISYPEALAEQGGADGLLLFQGAQFNVQIPAKAYEYLRIKRPVLALTDPRGDTAALLAEIGNGSTVAIDDEEEIARVLMVFLSKLKANEFRGPDKTQIMRYSRLVSAEKLANTLNAINEGV